MTGPTPGQHAELTRLHENASDDLDRLVDVHSCDRLNGGDQVTTAALLADKLSAGTPAALASLLAVAIARLAEQGWAAK